MNVNDEEILKIYDKIKMDIEKRLMEFKNIGKTDNLKELFCELAFCILTPQSKAKNAWRAILELKKDDKLFNLSSEEMSKYLNVVRFKNNKAKYLVEAREKIFETKKLDIMELVNSDIEDVEKRSSLLKNIKGYGYKEASHFLRNIGYGQNIAILDRHILRNLQKSGIIDEIKLTNKLYLDIELKMKKYSKKLDIPLDALDLVLWYKEAGEIFK